ncbi:hypothetical protein N7528_009480 [Penicillium herquei]|nr:hypothetical protein N7528_009480 [Penicillium herquei]
MDPKEKLVVSVTESESESKWTLDTFVDILVSSYYSLPPVSSLFDLAWGKQWNSSFQGVQTPLPRKRALTLPLPENTETTWNWKAWKRVGPKTEEQSQCLLLNRLPAEIRLQIYGYVLGNKTTRIWRSNDGFQHTSARTEDLLPRLMNINGCFMPRWHRWRNSDPIICATGNLSLLLTCRKIYSEAIDILYSGNTIRLLDNNHPAFTLPQSLQQIFLPERFLAIRSLEIPITLTTMQSYLQYHRKDLALASGSWKEPLPQDTWDIVAMMKGLRELKVRFQCTIEAYVENEEGLPSPTEENLLMPLMKLDWIPNFSVEVSWAENRDSERVLRNAPFEIIRKCEEEVEAYYEKTWW